MITTDRRFGVNGNLAFKAPVRAATTTNITLSGLQTVDGVSLAADDRVLVKNQTSSVDNGFYDVSSGAWTRSVDANGNRDLVKGTHVEVTDGTVNGGTIYKLSGTNPILPGSSAMTFALSLTASISTLSFLQQGTGASARTAQAKMREVFTAEDFGATGDGVTDDTTALTDAAAAALVAGVGLQLLPGRTYIHDGAFQPAVTVYGWGATLKQKKTVVQGTDTPGTLHLSATTDVYVYGLTVDGNNKWPGITADGCTRPLFFGTTAKNCITFGHAVLNSTEVTVFQAKSRTVAYRQTGVAGLAADGFYHSKCTDVKYTGCNAYDFRRIGFVSEGDGSTKSDFIKYANCDASNANNCDDSTTEYNAAFWAENTNNVELVNCTGRNLAGNAGQTSARVWGIALQIGEGRVCQQSLTNCEIDGGDGNVAVAYSVTGTSQRPTINVVNCSARNCVSGLATTGGIDVLHIKNFQGDAITTTASSGGLLFDISGSAINVIDVDGVSFTNGSFNADSGWIVFYSGNASTVYNLRNMHGGTHVMHAKVARATVDDSTVSYGSATYGSFLADEVRFKGGFRGVLRAGAVKNTLVDTSSASSDIYFEPGAQLVEASYFQQALGGTCNIWANGAKFKNVGFAIQMTGSFTTKFVGCNIEGADATHGFIESSATAFTRWELLATGNRCTGGTPFVKVTGNPTFSILHDNTSVHATLYSFTANVTQANNVNTP